MPGCLCGRFGRRLAETEREAGSAPLKRIWQSEVTGPGREEEAGVAGRDSSLVTKTAGLRYRVSPHALFASLSSGCSDLNFFFFSQSVAILEFILKALKGVFFFLLSYKVRMHSDRKKCLLETRRHRLHKV